MQKISLLVPFRANDAHRQRIWNWLHNYWQAELPNAEIVVGDDPSGKDVFSKTCAVNNAFDQSHGDIIVILDADAYLSGRVIQHCARRLRHARWHGARTWFIPYRNMYRLNEDITDEVLESDPDDPFRPDLDDVEIQDASGSGYAHQFGALIQIMPREAFEMVGGMDRRFRGWGGEDVSFLRAVDTLWGRHKNIADDVYHLWHPKLGTPGHNPFIRAWENQDAVGPNDRLATKYRQATWKLQQMRDLMEGGQA